MAKNWKEFVNGRMFILSQKVKTSGLMAYIPQSNSERTVGLAIFGEDITKKVNAIKARYSAAANGFVVQVNKMAFISAHARPMVMAAQKQAEEEMDKLLEEQVYPHINALKAAYQQRVDEALKLEKLEGEELEKVRKHMYNKFPEGGPVASFITDIFSFPREEMEDEELKASHARLTEGVFSALVGARLARLAEITANAEQRLGASGAVHGSTLKAAKLAYVQMADEVEELGLPAMSEVLSAFKTIMVDRADDIGGEIGVAYMHFFNANMYNVAVQFGCTEAMSAIAEKLGGHDALVEAAESLPLKDLMVTLAGGEQDD